MKAIDAGGAVIRQVNPSTLRRRVRLAAALAGMAWVTCACAGAQRIATSPAERDVRADFPTANSRTEEGSLPDAPIPNVAIAPGEGDSAANSAPQQNQRQTSPGFPPISPSPPVRLPAAPGEHPGIPSLQPSCQTRLCTAAPDNLCCARHVDYFQRFVDAGVHPLTPREKGILAFRNAVDPYNFATIAFFSAISVASDPNSAYGPGFHGFARNFGVAYTESAVGEFFGTFLIPSIAHQDPHYHRLPNASYPRRILHAITQVGWAQSDYGTGMPNYANLIGTAVDIGLGNVYVPGRDTSWDATVARYGTAIGTAPIGNFITEFLPDVARRVNVRIVLLQQIVNHVERSP